MPARETFRRSTRGQELDKLAIFLGGHMKDRTPIQSLAALVGAVFLLVGVLGFIPGITTHYGDLSFAGHDSGAKLLGIFQTSILHNLIHVAFGVGILMAKTVEGARTYLIGGGVVYLVVWLIGVIGGLDWLPVNTADNWLHIVLGVGMIALGFVAGGRRSITTAPA
jgi:hypothetical protein